MIGGVVLSLSGMVNSKLRGNGPNGGNVAMNSQLLLLLEGRVHKQLDVRKFHTTCVINSLQDTKNHMGTKKGEVLTHRSLQSRRRRPRIPDLRPLIRKRECRHHLIIGN